MNRRSELRVSLCALALLPLLCAGPLRAGHRGPVSESASEAQRDREVVHGSERNPDGAAAATNSRPIDGDDDDEAGLESDFRLVVAPGKMFTPHHFRSIAGGNRMFEDNGVSLRLQLILAGDRGPSDVDIVLDTSVALGHGDRLADLAFGVRWIPFVRPRLTPFLGGGLSQNYVHVDGERLSGCCDKQNYHTWGGYLGLGLEFNRYSLEGRAQYLHSVLRERVVLYSVSLGFGF